MQVGLVHASQFSGAVSSREECLDGERGEFQGTYLQMKSLRGWEGLCLLNPQGHPGEDVHTVTYAIITANT